MRITDGGRPIVTSLLLLLLLLYAPGEGCGPGRGSGRRRRPRKLTPLVFKQHVPNVSENTLGASGLTDGRIKRGDARFKSLVRNNNPDILFKDEEGNGVDRIMSQRCKDKLNTLAISVLNQWPGVKLRVTEAWDEDGMHAENSLHYEGRAVDITTSDRDRSKYGMLARLAVEAGFDWVYYETRGHIHCSVKSDSSVAINFGGCFPPASHVVTSTGQTKTMAELEIGDKVLSVSGEGKFEFSDVMAFLDRGPEQIAMYYTLTTESGRSVSLTPKHLIYYADPDKDNSTLVIDQLGRRTPFLNITQELPRVTFAEDVVVGQYILLARGDGLTSDLQQLPHRQYHSTHVSDVEGLTSVGVVLDRVVSIEKRPIQGVYAPLTTHGTIVVDGYITSCYAFLQDVHLAHAVFAPMRAYHVIRQYINDWLKYLDPCFDWLLMTSSSMTPANETASLFVPDGSHWYAKLLYNIGVYIIGMDIFITM
ncbi:sonic hedgehog protein A [Biomphalaria glabrata]|uniref:Hedgehog protein n=2 Tax=Biomphalaria TaxID=6525 RepID=A0A9W2YA32_BIOGL|nr:sonic hedgehog protein [Biomphalaria glabrata]XP_055859707.1 sonic hedgehog protein [Biomphalaria glabrata]XP_055859708.1 sonic hedgehog protein [Biomphalaria glabrata]XP_055859709.1 sonic hedgehog protein [Biomphalaria glabrata]XP_055859710.1 sonic hedgehog protein [Biomphalaria glabrata]XP_055859711.1 sonic hedgehog protein [Biomphalaria glabrata]XP_055859712.1 sonic hedgehog protein [Biomphalaria glabrata]XP_055859713.1 sonic hedgehog protein [Biomphalaria glabrata]XP_055859714.1 soni